jgi:hypothetical protein
VGARAGRWRQASGKPHATWQARGHEHDQWAAMAALEQALTWAQHSGRDGSRGAAPVRPGDAGASAPHRRAPGSGACRTTRLGSGCQHDRPGSANGRNAEPASSVSAAAARAEPCGARLQALRLPLITGYVLGGVLVGPFGLNLLRAEGLPSLAVVRARLPQTPTAPARGSLWPQLAAPCLRWPPCAMLRGAGKAAGALGFQAHVLLARGAGLAPGVHCAHRRPRCARASLCCA